MSMVVRTNSMAMSANSALNKNNSTVAGNLQKLSTGFRINRAADDASGLAVSEKMKAQIKALDQAGKNAQDGASLIKTAEGYMGEIHDMLNRVVELAEKSANGTYETKTDATTGKAVTEAYNATGVDRQAIQDEVDQLTTEIDRIAATANFNGLKLLNGDLDGTGGEDATGAALKLQIGETSNSADKLEVNVKSFATKDLFSSLTSKVANASAAYTTAASDGKITDGLTINVSNQDKASTAAEEIRSVINTVSSRRAELGAMENRLEYTMHNLDTASQNISDANSRIRDTDMAKTMMQYTQGNTLTQAAQAMLAQANQAPSQVLQLLQ